MRKVTLPSGFKAFESLYLMETEHSGTAVSGSSTSIVLDSDASDSDDAYNSYILRTTGGTGDGQQFTITDYDGDTVTATVSSTIATGFSTDTTFVIYKEPVEDNKLIQISHDDLLGNYGSTGIPEAYAITAPSSETSYMLLGSIPNDIFVLHGWYYAIPTKVTATTSTLPFQPIFDELTRQFVTFSLMNRDEYDTKVELAFLNTMEERILDIIMSNREQDNKSIGYKGVNDL